MWKIVRTPPPTRAQPEQDTNARRILALEADMKSLRSEWEDLYDKVLRLLRRLNKRAQDLQAREETPEDAPEPTNGGPMGIDPISAKILARRARVSPRSDGSDG